MRLARLAPCMPAGWPVVCLKAGPRSPRGPAPWDPGCMSATADSPPARHLRGKSEHSLFLSATQLITSGGLSPRENSVSVVNKPAAESSFADFRRSAALQSGGCPALPPWKKAAGSKTISRNSLGTAIVSAGGPPSGCQLSSSSQQGGGGITHAANWEAFCRSTLTATAASAVLRGAVR